MMDELVDQYATERVLTASPAQLQVFLYQAALNRCDDAKRGIDAHAYERVQVAFEGLNAILNELESSLRPEIDSNLCENMAQLYRFCTIKLASACSRHDLSELADVRKVLAHMGETWQMVVDREQMTQTQPSPTAQQDSVQTGFSILCG